MNRATAQPDHSLCCSGHRVTHCGRSAIHDLLAMCSLARSACLAGQAMSQRHHRGATLGHRAQHGGMGTMACAIACSAPCDSRRAPPAARQVATVELSASSHTTHTLASLEASPRSRRAWLTRHPARTAARGIHTRARPRCTAASTRTTSPVTPDAPARASFAPFSRSPTPY